MAGKTARKYNRFSPEFREQAVRLVLENSRPIAQVAPELGVNEGTLGNWVNQYRAAHVEDEAPMTPAERAQLAEAQREVREVPHGERVPKKSRSVLHPGSPVTETYEFIDSFWLGAKYAYPLRKMCAWLDVSKSGFCSWRNRPASATALRRADLAAKIQTSFAASDGTYGYRRLHAELLRLGEQCGPELVRHLMAELELVPCQPRPRVGLTKRDQAEHHIPDLLKQDFTAARPGTTLIGDITYVATWEGWLYLATVIDVHTRMVIGYAMDDNYRTPVISAALRNATRNQPLAADAIFPSDRGSNYTSAAFAATVADLDMRQSMGRTGICYDNAMAESFFAALKNERVSRTVYPTRRHARADISRYIELWYLV